MVESIESFISRLQADGVQAGQQAADKLLREAQAQADAAVKQAHAQAQDILAGARKEAQGIVQRAQGELQLAARDAALKLQDALRAALAGLLRRQVRKGLEDAQFLKTTLHDLISQYAKADIAQATLTINLSAESRKDLLDWAMNELSQNGHPSLDLRGTLATAGFEYSVNGSTVDVTLESVVETLMDMLTPELREALKQAMKQ